MTRKAFTERISVPEKYVKALVKQALQARTDTFHSATSLDFYDLVYDESYIRSYRPPQDIGLLLESFFFKTREGLERPGYKVDISRNDSTRCVLVSALSADNIPCREMIRSDEVNGFISSPPRIRRITSTTSDANMFSINDTLSDITGSHAENHLIQFSLDGKKFETHIGKDHVEIPLNLNDRNEILTPATLRRSTNHIFISLFDLIDVRIGHDELSFGKDIIISKEKRFLGFVEIPLLALYSHNNIRYNGTVMLNTPPIIFGYKSKAYQSLQSRAVDIEEGAALTRKVHPTSLQISMMIQPEVHYLPHPIQPLSSIAEIKKIIEYSHKWIEQFHQINQFSASRNVILFGYHLEKKSHLLTQYLKPQNPPPEFTSLHQVAHFVSLIPRLRTWKAFESDIENLSWITNQQVLDSSAADWEARAILLANYFLSLIDVNQDVFLVFGTSFSEGKVVSKIRVYLFHIFKCSSLVSVRVNVRIFHS